MDNRDLYFLNKAMLQQFRMKHVGEEVKEVLKNYSSEEALSVEFFLTYLIQSGRAVGLIYMSNHATEKEVRERIENIQFPFIAFYKEAGVIRPVMFYVKNNESYAQLSLQEEMKSADFLSRGIEFYKEKSGEHESTYLVVCYPHQMSSSLLQLEQPKRTSRWPVLNSLYKIIYTERREIGYLYIYAVIAGVISLSLPLGIQSIIGFVSSGQLSTSVYVLMAFIILGIMITGGMQVMQLYLVEYIQRRIFARTAFDFAFRIPKFRIEALRGVNTIELMNRFFDVVTVQKGLAKILIEFSASFLQILFGLVLLALYHSAFMVFGMVLVAVLYLILRFTGPLGMKSSIQESKYKYKLVAWLEEVARSLSTFKLAGFSNLPVEKTNHYLARYLTARKDHFKILIGQYLSFVGFKTVITGGLLILGCTLLIRKEINIGQFVASEIVIILIMNAVEKMIIQLDVVYDLLTALEKVNDVSDIPIEISNGLNPDHVEMEHGFSCDIDQLTYQYPGEERKILDDVSLEIKAGERVCLAGPHHSGRTTLVHILLGYLSNYKGSVNINHISVRNYNRNFLLSYVGDNIAQEDIFEGTILENITLGRPGIRLNDITNAIQMTCLDKLMKDFPDGLQTKLSGGAELADTELSQRIILTRSIVNNPSLLLLEDTFSDMPSDEKDIILEHLTDRKKPWTLIFISNDEYIQNKCDRVIYMEKGKVVQNKTSYIL